MYVILEANLPMLQVINYNVMFNPEYLPYRHKALIKLLNANKADVVCLQEVRTELVSWFIDKLAPNYIPVNKELLPIGRAYGEMIFIGTNVKLLSSDCFALESKMGRALLHAEIQRGSTIYNIITFHFESLNCKKYRQQQICTLWLRTVGLPNVICCGDTNMTDAEQYQIPANFLDAWKQTDKKTGEYTYYGDRFWGNQSKQRYDKMWYSNTLQLDGFGILGNKPIGPGVWISDHDGLYGSFQ